MFLFTLSNSLPHVILIQTYWKKNHKAANMKTHLFLCEAPGQGLCFEGAHRKQCACLRAAEPAGRAGADTVSLSLVSGSAEAAAPREDTWQLQRLLWHLAGTVELRLGVCEGSKPVCHGAGTFNTHSQSEQRRLNFSFPFFFSPPSQRHSELTHLSPRIVESLCVRVVACEWALFVI